MTLQVSWSRKGKFGGREAFEDEPLAVLEAAKLLNAGFSVAVTDPSHLRRYAFCSVRGCASIAAVRIMRQVSGWPRAEYVCPMCDARTEVAS